MRRTKRPILGTRGVRARGVHAIGLRALGVSARGVSALGVSTRAASALRSRAPRVRARGVRLLALVAISVTALGCPALAVRAEAQDVLVGVAASRRAEGGVVAWSERALFVGDSEATGFRTIALPGIERLAIDDDGTMLIARVAERNEWGLEVVRPDGTIERVAGARPGVLGAGAGVLAYIDQDGGVWRSDDRARHWLPVALPESCEMCGRAIAGHADLEIDNDGALVIAEVSINTCTSVDRLEWQRLLRAPRGRPFAQITIALDPADYAAPSWEIGAFGWAYGVSYAGRLLASSGLASHVIAPRQSEGAALPSVAHNGRATVVSTPRALLQVHGTRTRLLDRSPPSIAALALDVRSRPLAIVGGSLRRFRRGLGWETLLAP